MGRPLPVKPFDYSEIGKLVGHIGRPGFESSLLGLLREGIGASHLGLFVINDNREVQNWSVIDDANRRETLETTRKFVTSIWPRDFTLFGIEHNGPNGIVLTRRRAVDVADPEYRELCYVRPGVVDRLLMSMRAGRTSLFLCAYRRVSDTVFTDENCDVAALLAPAVLAACERHFAFSNGRTAYTEESSTLDESALSGRERQVADLIAAGSTSREIADELGISHHTVLTYRKRIYEKLGVGTQRDLLARRYELAFH